MYTPLNNISRKTFLKGSALGFAALPFGIPDLSALVTAGAPEVPLLTADKISVSIFSKHLHWLDYQEMAKVAAEMGFDGVDLTVRDGGHVLPQNVTRDLPKAVEIIREAGLEIYTITTDITDASDKDSQNVLKTAAELGIKNYRMGWYNYEKSGDILANLAIIERKLAELAEVNERYQIHGDYENHTGSFGGPIWDLWLGLKDLDPRWIGCQFDIRHATVDGAEAWPTNFRLLKNYIGSLTIKDFHWKKEKDKWLAENVSLGQGMVDFPQYFKLVKELGIKKPLSLHLEYPLGGAESGKSSLSIPSDEVLKSITADLKLLRSWLVAHGLLN